MCLKENIALTTVDEGKYLDIYLPLVKRVVRQLSFQADSVIEREDMQQIALMGLLEALRRYGHPDGNLLLMRYIVFVVLYWINCVNMIGDHDA